MADEITHFYSNSRFVVGRFFSFFGFFLEGFLTIFEGRVVFMEINYCVWVLAINKEVVFIINPRFKLVTVSTQLLGANDSDSSQ